MTSGILAAALAVASAVAPGAAAPRPAQGVSETGDPHLDYKLRASRAEQAYRVLLDSTDEIVELSASLAKRVGERGALADDDVKSVDRIRKLAKRLRSEMGGSGDPRLETPPATLGEATAALAARADALAEQMRKASRFETNARLIAIAGEVMLLSDVVKRLGK
jgi:hypothetical protein